MWVNKKSCFDFGVCVEMVVFMVFCHKISFVGVNLCKVLLLSEIFLRLNSLVLPSRQFLSKSDLARDFVTGY